MEGWAQLHAELQGSTKQRLLALDELQAQLAHPRKQLSREQLHDLVDAAGDLLADNNFKVAQGTLVVLASLVQADSDAVKPYVHILVPCVVERLGDARQTVRQEACSLLLTMLSSGLPAPLLLEKMARFWSHRSWKVRHGLLQTVAEAISMRIPGLLETPEQATHLITCAVNALEDRNDTVREAAQDCLQELYRSLGQVLLDNLGQQGIRPAVLRDLLAKLDRVAPTNMTMASSPDVSAGHAPPALPMATRSSAPLQPEPGAVVPSGATPSGSLPSRLSGGARRGGVPEAPAPAPVVAVVTSEKELVTEMADMAAPLSGTTVDWTTRLALMQRLVALVVGCPPALHDALLEGLRPLREPLARQVEDRRSAISKQACQLLAALAGVLGPRFAELLLVFLPFVARVLPITIQVMADAADTCCLAMLASCPSSRAVAWLAGSIVRDKSARVRACCGSYIAHVLAAWDTPVLAKCCEDVEGAIRALCMDANADARASGRRAYAAYCTTFPDAAQAFTRSLPPSMVEKLLMKPGSAGSSVGGSSSHSASRTRRVPRRPPSAAGSQGAGGGALGDPDIIVLAPPRPATAGPQLGGGGAGSAGSSASLHGASATQGAASSSLARSTGAHASRVAVGGPASAVGGSIPPDMPPLPPDRRSANGRKSMAAPGRVHAALGLDAPQLSWPQSGPASVARVTGGMSSVSLAAGSETAVKPTASRSLARRASVGAPGAVTAGSWGSSLPQRVPATPQPTSSTPHEVASSAPTTKHRVAGSGSPSTKAGEGQPDNLVTTEGDAAAGPHHARTHGGVGPVVSALLSGQRPWNEKAELLQGLGEAVRAAAGAEGGALPPDMARDLDRLPHKLLECVEDGHVKVSAAALALLGDCLAIYPRLLEPHLDRALPVLFGRLQDAREAVRAGAARTLQEAARRYGADALLLGLVRAMDAAKAPRVKQAVLEFGAAHLGSGTPAGCPAPHAALIKQWLRALAVLVADKSPDLRKAACDALATVYTRIDAGAVAAYVRHASGTEGLALRRALADIEASQAGSTTAMDTPAPSVAGGGSTARGTGGTQSQSAQAKVLHDVPQPSAYEPQDYMTPHKVGAEQSVRAGQLRVDAGGGQLGAGLLPMHQVLPMHHPNNTSDPGSGLPSQPGNLRTSEYGVCALVTPQPAAGLGLKVGMVPSVPLTLSAGLAAARLTSDVEPAGPRGLPSAPPLVVPPDAPGQARLLHLLLVRLASCNPLDVLRQLEEVCVPQVLPGAWAAVWPQLLAALSRKVLADPAPAVRVAGLRLIASVAVHHPQLLAGPGAVQELVAGLAAAGMGCPPLVAKAALDTLDAVLDAVPLPTALTALTAQLQASSVGGGMVLRGLCTGVQHALARVAQDGGAALALPSALLHLLRAAADDELLEVRKAAIYALAQMRIALGEARFSESHAIHLTPCQRQLVAWAITKLREASPASVLPSA